MTMDWQELARLASSKHEQRPWGDLFATAFARVGAVKLALEIDAMPDKALLALCTHMLAMLASIDGHAIAMRHSVGRRPPKYSSAGDLVEPMRAYLEVGWAWRGINSMRDTAVSLELVIAHALDLRSRVLGETGCPREWLQRGLERADG